MMRKPKKPKAKPKQSSKSQSERFIETAREVEADESSSRFATILRKILKTKYTAKDETQKTHKS
jgi:hypothetical protein